MTHPLAWIPDSLRRPVFWGAVLLNVAIYAVFMTVLNPPLVNDAAPNGIVSFELAGTPEAAQAMLASWSPTDDLFNAFGLGFDFLFMPGYATALAMGTLLAAPRRAGAGWGGLGTWLGWGAYAAVVFDVVENAALFHLLVNDVNATAPVLAFWCATLKFALIVLALLYGLAGWLLPQKQ